jgi:hypothetical protein
MPKSRSSGIDHALSQTVLIFVRSFVLGKITDSGQRLTTVIKKKKRKGSCMEKGTCEKIPVKIDARFFCGDMFYSGTISNLSTEDMHINTKRCFPLGTRFVTIIRNGKDLLQVNTKVKGLTLTKGCYDGMDVEILNQSKNYLDYVNSLSPVRMISNDFLKGIQNKKLISVGNRCY